MTTYIVRSAGRHILTTAERQQAITRAEQRIAAGLPAVRVIEVRNGHRVGLVAVRPAHLTAAQRQDCAERGLMLR